MMSKLCSNGGSTPSRDWVTPTVFANCANSCAALLKSLFRCFKFQLPNALRKLMIPWKIEPNSPMIKFELIAWTTNRESDSMTTWLSPLSRARRIPSLTAKASVVLFQTFHSTACSLLLLPCPHSPKWLHPH